jgi:LysM repeat protein
MTLCKFEARKREPMTRKNSPCRVFALSITAIFLCAGFVNVSAQESRTPLVARSSVSRKAQPNAASHARLKPATKRSSNRPLVKIRSRAGDTLGLLADRFGISAEEIAALNNIHAGAQLRPGSELLIPLPSPEMLARTPVGKTAQPDGSNSSGTNGVASAETEEVWENVQGVLFRKGSSTRSSGPDAAEVIRGGERGSERTASSNAPLTGTVKVIEAERNASVQPVWIYLVGGARVEADSVNETEEGVWYTRGNLSIFIERSRIERIEHERLVSMPEESSSWTERGWTTGNPKFDALIKENGARYGVDPYLIFCVMEQESQFKPGVVSPKGARGLMQLMPGTAAHFGVRRPFDPAENIMGGTKYLKQLLENFNGRVDLVLAGYNAGEGAVAKYGGRVPPYRETRNYVQRISKRYGQSRSFVAGTGETAPAPSGLR